MRKVDSRILFSARDLVAFLGCRQRTILDLRNLDTPLERSEAGDMGHLAAEKGIEHGRRCLERLRLRVQAVEEIPSAAHAGTRRDLTLQAMKPGAPVIYQAYLMGLNRGSTGGSAPSSATCLSFIGARPGPSGWRCSVGRTAPRKEGPTPGARQSPRSSPGGARRQL